MDQKLLSSEVPPTGDSLTTLCKKELENSSQRVVQPKTKTYK